MLYFLRLTWVLRHRLPMWMFWRGRRRASCGSRMLTVPQGQWDTPGPTISSPYSQVKLFPAWTKLSDSVVNSDCSYQYFTTKWRLQFLSGRTFTLHARDRGSFPGPDRPVFKTGSDNFTVKCSAIGVSVTGLGDDHYKWMTCATVGVTR